MKKLLLYNKVVFNAGYGWRKWAKRIWMITMPIFVLSVLFLDIGAGDSLFNLVSSQGGTSYLMVFWFILFGGFYPIRNYLEVKRILNLKSNQTSPKEYKDILNLYNFLK